jgi:hypothetical protein
MIHDIPTTRILETIMDSKRIKKMKSSFVHMSLKVLKTIHHILHVKLIKISNKMVENRTGKIFMPYLSNLN